MNAIVELPRAVDVCPNARRCAHRPGSRVGDGGACPDCGHQVFLHGARMRASSRNAAFHVQASYHGGYE